MGTQDAKTIAQMLEFHYDPSPQRSPQWLERKRGKIGASEIWRWLSVSKAAKTLGQPLKERLDYEKELMFERQFNTSFSKWVSGAMDDGVELEDWAATQYEQITGQLTVQVGCFYNDFLVASPDRMFENAPGIVEIKLLKDSSFLEVIANIKLLEENDQAGLEKTTTIKKHWKQMQTQMWASKQPWCDYVPVNTNTRKVVIIRVYADPEFHEYLELAVQEKLVQTQFDTEHIHEVIGEIPSWAENTTNNDSDGGW